MEGTLITLKLAVTKGRSKAARCTITYKKPTNDKHLYDHRGDIRMLITTSYMKDQKAGE